MSEELFLLFFIAIIALWLRRALFAYATLKALPVLDPSSRQKDLDGELVTVIIPAKNEEANIIPCLNSLFNQDYSNYEIIVVNDNSSDSTEEKLKSLATVPRLRYLNASPTPPGWTGKNFALSEGVVHARGQWLLFTDADTRHERTSLSTAIHHAVSHHLELLTLLPRCVTKGFWEKLLQPFAMAYLGLWFPIQKVNDPHSSVHFANGQYLLIHRHLYEKLQGHSGVREAFLEDFALMKKAKRAGGAIQCASGVALYGTRMYTSLSAIWKGWRRIYLHAFERNSCLLITKAFLVFFSSLLPFLALFLYSILLPSFSLSLYLGITACLLPLAVSWVGYAIIGADRAYSLLHPLAAIFFSAILIDAWRMALLGTPTKWR